MPYRPAGIRQAHSWGFENVVHIDRNDDYHTVLNIICHCCFPIERDLEIGESALSPMRRCGFTCKAGSVSKPANRLTSILEQGFRVESPCQYPKRYGNLFFSTTSLLRLTDWIYGRQRLMDQWSVF